MKTNGFNRKLIFLYFFVYFFVYLSYVNCYSMKYIIKEDLYRLMNQDSLKELNVTEFQVDSCINSAISEANGYVGHRFDLSVTSDITVVTDLDDIDTAGTYCYVENTETGDFVNMTFYTMEIEEDEPVLTEIDDPRNIKLVECMCKSAIYHIHGGGSAHNIPDTWVQLYRGIDSKVVSCDSALGWLRDMSKGDKTSENMTVKTDEDGVNEGERISVFVSDVLEEFPFI